MKNRDIYQRDPDQISLLNNGVVTVMDAATQEELRTLRFELEHFVCEGEYQRGLARILQSYVSCKGQPEQAAAWVSGFFGSGKSHLVKMLRYLWIDYTFPEDGASARGLAHLPEDVRDLLKELSTWGKRQGGLRAAAGTLGAGSSESVRLALLGVVFKSAGLPEDYPQARFCLWLRKNGIYDEVQADVAAAGRDFRKELNDLYVSPVIAKALLKVDPEFAGSEKDAKAALRTQFSKPRDITNDELVTLVQEVLAPAGEMPCTVIILDEVQQYIGEDSSRSYTVQEVVEACSKRFGDRLLFVGTGQTALSGTPALMRLQGRFTVNVELSDYDVETVTRRVVLAKRADRTADIRAVLDKHSAEIDRQLAGTRIAPTPEDRALLVEDYPLLPVRRRFWEHILRAVDRAGTTGQLRTQLRIVYDAIRLTADAPLGTVVPADFLFDEIGASLLRSGVLLHEINEVIRKQDDGSEDGRLRARLCALVFLIRKLPRESGIDIGVRATAEILADLLIEALPGGGATLRAKVPVLLDAMADKGVLMKVDNEYSLQTRESSEWEQDFRTRAQALLNDQSRMSGRRDQLLMGAVQEIASALKIAHGKCREARRLALHFGSDAPAAAREEIPLWVRDGWSTEEKSALADARAAGNDSPLITLYIPKSQADALRKSIAEEAAAQDTLNARGVPTGAEGTEAREAMKTRHIEAERQRKGQVAAIINGAKVIQGGGSECFGANVMEKLRAAAEASLDRMFPDFRDADDDRWPKVIERARKGAEHPLEPLEFNGKTEEHPVCAAVLSHVGSGKKGRDIRNYFSEAPYGWPRDAVDAALISLFETGHLRAGNNGVPFKPRQLDQAKISQADFRTETATVSVKQRMALRKLCQDAGVDCKPNEEANAAGPLLQRLMELSRQAGGEAPLPPRPDTSLIQTLQAISGNELVISIADRQAELRALHEQWSKQAELGAKRLPGFQELTALMRMAGTEDFATDIRDQFDAIVQQRTLLQETDPVPGLTKALVKKLRQAITTAESSYTKVYDDEMSELEATECWKKITEEDRKAILRATGIAKLDKGALATDHDVLTSLERISMDAWRTKTTALPQQFTEARLLAEKKLEPKVQQIRLSSGALRTSEEVEKWLLDTRQQLLDKLKKGPIVIN